MPQTIKAVLTRYCWRSFERLAPAWPPMRSGGVIIPASIARACWKPRSKASRSGIESLRPKNGAGRRFRRTNGRFGLKRKA